MKKFKFLPHTADIKFRVFGKNLGEIFENSALAVSEFLSRGQKIKAKRKKSISLVSSSSDLNLLFYKFLDDLVFFLDAENFLIAKAKVTVKNGHLKATLYGDKASDYKDLDHIKAATYSEMYIKKIKNSWEGQAVMDV